MLTYISGFNQSIAITDSVLAIGLDKYLGRDNPVYRELDFSRYLVYNYTPNRIPIDAVRGWIMGDFPYSDSVNNLISHMVYEGKVLYLAAQLLPNVSDSTLFGYSPQQMKWCKSNEKTMWTHLIEQKFLFSTDQFMVAKFVNGAYPAPVRPPWYSPALLSNPFNPISISWLTWLRVMVTLELNVLHFTFDGSPAVSTCLRSIRIMGFVSAFNVW